MPSPLSVLRRVRPPADAGTLRAYTRTGDPELLAELVRRHGGLVWGVCRRALPHRPDAEDAFQATWLVLASNPGAVRTPAALPGFLHTVAVRISRRARAKRPVVADAGEVPGREPPAADVLLAAERLRALDDELGKLPEKLRRPLVLHHLDGRTHDEAAALLGVSPSTLKRRLDAGRELLRVRLAGRGVDAGAALAAAGLGGVGTPAVVAGAAGPGAVALSTEAVTAMWMLKLKGWTAGVVVVAGLAATGGGLMQAGGQAPGGPGAPPGGGLGGGMGPGGAARAPAAGANNFAVVGTSPEVAGRLIAAAEAARRDLAVRWLGRELPPWPEPCPIRYQPAGGPDRGGATHFTFGNARVLDRKMDLSGDLEAVLADHLPHEVMHTVLADGLGFPPPRWADEGIAGLAESARSQRAYVARTAEFVNAGRALALPTLLALDEYLKDVPVLFAQGYSVCRFLRDRAGGGEGKLVEFVRRGRADGWPAAARGVYGFADLDAMQAEWLTSLRVPAADPPAGGSGRGGPPAGPGVGDPVRAAYEQMVRELEKTIIAADEAVAALSKTEEQLRVLPGVTAAEKLSSTAQAARAREAAAQNRVKLAEVRVEMAKLGPAPAAPAVPAGPESPAMRLKRETAEQALELDRAVRRQEAIAREEAATLAASAIAWSRRLYDAQRAFPLNKPGADARLIAARGWYVRAAELHRYYQARAERGLNRRAVALDTLYARTEALAALTEAMRAAAPAARADLSPFAAAPPGYAGKLTDALGTVGPVAGLKDATVLRLVRGGQPVGSVVVRYDPAIGDLPAEAFAVPLPDPDGTIPALQVGDDVRP